MNTQIKCIVSFVAGAAVGSLTLYKFIDKKCQTRANEQIDSVVQMYKLKEDILDKVDKSTSTEFAEMGQNVVLGFAKGIGQKVPAEPQYSPEEKKDYEEVSSLYSKKDKNDSVLYSKITEKTKPIEKEEKGGEPVTNRKPYVISQDDYDEESYEGDVYYDKIEYIYYADKVLADECDELIDASATVGEDFDSFFPEDEDAMYIRDDVKKIDYEITRDNRTYADVTGQGYDPSNEH